MSTWFQRFADAVYREYDRRIKRASLVTEYGAHHDHHDHHDPHNHHSPGDDAAPVAADHAQIVNVAPGTAVGAPDGDDDEVAIVNVPRGTVVQPDPASESDPGDQADGQQPPPAT